ncbi:MAG: hypothetical protein ABMA25_00175 [Ilumatobacteraceae bacterium]
MATRRFLAVTAFAMICSMVSGATATADWTLDGVTSPTSPAVLLAKGQTRLSDSRPGGRTVDGTSSGAGPLSPGVIRKVTVAGRASVATSGAVVLNIEAVNPRGTGYLTAWSCNQPQPTTSLLNTTAGGPSAANTLIVELGTSKLCILSTGATDLVVDLQEQFSAAANFVPATGTLRVVDTRNGTGGLTRLAPGVATRLPDLAAEFVNVTAVNPAAAGHLSIQSCDAHFDFVSTVNFGAATTANVANPRQTDTCVTSSVATDLIIDRVGNGPADPNGVARGGFIWSRLLDTRRTSGNPPDVTRLKAGVPTRIALYGQYDAWPARAGAVALDLIAVRSSGSGELRTYKCAGTPRTTAMYPTAAHAVSHLTFIDLSKDGSFCVVSTVDTDLIIDGAMWFATPLPPLRVESQLSCSHQLAPATIQLDGDGGLSFNLDVSGGVAPYTLTLDAPAGWQLAVRPTFPYEPLQPFGMSTPPLSLGSVTFTITIRDRAGASATFTYVAVLDGRMPLPGTC